MAITKATASAVAPAAKGDLVVGSATNDAAVLAVGSANQVLTVDSSTTTGLKWAAASAGGKNFSLVNAGGTALTGAATITVSGISNADEIFVLIENASCVNSGSGFHIRLNGDTATNYSAYGLEYIFEGTYSAGPFRPYTSNATSVITIGQMSTNAGSVVAGGIRIIGCNSSGKKMYQSWGGGNANTGNSARHYFLGGAYNSSSTISSVSVYSDSGDFDAGTVYVYTSS